MLYGEVLNISAFIINMEKKEEKRREIRIFLSSTFRDLNDERTYLVNVVFPKLIRICRERDLFLTVVDLRWGISNPDEESVISHVMDVCLREIDRARPFFIGILGGRYGYVPKGDKNITQGEIERWKKDATKWKWFEEGYSITQMEMEYGALSKPEMAEYSYFYFKSAKSSHSREENEEYLRKLDELKNEIRVEDSKWHWSRKEFESPQELGEHIEKDFVQMLDTVYPKEERLSPLERERLIQKQYSKFLLRGYVSSEKTVEKILDGLERHNRILITGEVGIGKSATLAYVKQMYEDLHKDALVVEHYIGAGGSDSSDGMALRIINEVKDYLEKRKLPFPEQEMPKSQDDILNSLPTWITSVPRWEKTLILIDGEDQLPNPTDLRFIAYLPENVKLLVSSRDVREYTEYLSNLNFEPIKLEKIDIETKKQIIGKFLEDQGKELSDWQIGRIARATQTGNPLYLRILLEELSKLSELSQGEEQDKFIDRQIERYLVTESIEEIYSSMLERIENVHSKYFSKDSRDLRDILTSIALSRSGLSENEIIRVNRIYSLSFTIIRNEMDYHLSEKNGLIDFFHYSLKEAVIKKYIKSQVDEISVRRKISDWFESHAPDERQIYELPFQLLLLNEKDRLRENLKRIEWFVLFIKNGNTDTKYYEFMNYIRSVYNDFCKGLKELYADKISNAGDPDNMVGLASLCLEGGCYAQAEPLLKEALEILKRSLGTNHPYVASTMSRLALLYHYQGKYSDAEPLYKEALEIQKHSLGTNHPSVSNTMSNLAGLYSDQGKYSDAEPLYKEALEILKRSLGTNHPDVAIIMSSLAALYFHQGKYSDAEPLYKEALEILKRSLGTNHPYVATTMSSLAVLYSEQGKYSDAEPLLKEALEIQKHSLGTNHPDVASIMNNLALLYFDQDKYSDAEPLLKEALEILKRSLGTNHPDVASIMNNLAFLYYKQGRYSDAETLFKEALDIYTNISNESISYENEVNLIKQTLEKLKGIRGKT